MILPDWIKVVPTSDGKNYVLMYLEHDTDNNDCQIIHCVNRFDGYDADITFRGIPNAKADAALIALANPKSADKIRAKVNQFDTTEFDKVTIKHG